MLFEEAVKELKKGSNHFVTRRKWEAECSYIVRLPGVPQYIKVTLQPQPGVSSWAATMDDIESADWELAVQVEEASLELSA